MLPDSPCPLPLAMPGFCPAHPSLGGCYDAGRVFSCALVGLDGAVVQVETDLNPKSLPAVTLVGLPDVLSRSPPSVCEQRSTTPGSFIPAAI